MAQSLSDPDKLKYEKQLIIDKYGLDPGKRLLLIANNDSKKQYSTYYTNKEIVSSWRNRIERVLNENQNTQVIFKLHPVWNTFEEFDRLVGVNDNLRVLKTGDMGELIKVTNVLIVRHSMAALEGIIQNVPTVSINTPPIPAGGFYKEVGGTIHADNDDEFVSVVGALLNKDSFVHKLAKQRRMEFIQDYLGLDPTHQGPTAKMRFVELLNEFASVNLKHEE